MAKDRRRQRSQDKEKSRSARDYSSLSAHKQTGKVLVPPLVQIPTLTPSSWIDDRLPEMLWCALLISELGRDAALNTFRNVIDAARKCFIADPARPSDADLTLSGIADLHEAVQSQIIAITCTDPRARSKLAPLLLFNNLPALPQWKEGIGIQPSITSWDHLKRSVAMIFDHQSQEATDCRWVRVMFQILTEQFKLPSKELFKQIAHYPEYGDQRRVRPTIRAAEISLNQLRQRERAWPSGFWGQCLKDSPCEGGLGSVGSTNVAAVGTTRDRVRRVRETLRDHFLSTMRTSAIDARHESIFGLAAYSLALLEETLSVGNSSAVVGRLALRSLLECLVSLAYLVDQDNAEVWSSYRSYGSGQAKLAFLKLDDEAVGDLGYVDVDLLRTLANEDRWMEFVSINIGNWGESNLRKMSEDAGKKGEYDRFYPWTSAFVHGNWAAVRNSCFTICLNPLHRLHRRLRSDTASQGDVVMDACSLVDQILEIIHRTYPDFSDRVTLQGTSG